MAAGHVDRAVVGAGIFGLFAALILQRRGLRVAVIDREHRPLLRASLVNQARLHGGYHYPRSVFTAFKSAGHGERFARDFPEAVNRSVRKVYAIARFGSVTDPAAFVRFCSHVGLPLTEVDPAQWFQRSRVLAAWQTREYTFDADAVRAALVARIDATGSAVWLLGTTVTHAHVDGDQVILDLNSGRRLRAGGVVNATYAATNALPEMLGFPTLPLKYEVAEVVLAKTRGPLEDLGLTVLDGPFFSVMPFGHTGLHSVTSVPHTPRLTSSATLPTFPCQTEASDCEPHRPANCCTCPARPRSAWPLMERLARSFLRPDIDIRYEESLFTIKTVLRTSEVDDGRPTIVLQHSAQPPIVTIFSGKVSTIFDLEEAL